VSPRRGTAVAIALVLGALAAAGCGLGPGGGVADVQLTVSRDFGHRVLLARTVDDVTESDTVMRVLERSADVRTSYGGDFVDAIDGLAGGDTGGGHSDWLFYVNGIESPVGASDVRLRGGEEVWWDYRDWSATLSVPAVVGQWPEPFVHGYEGDAHPVAVECDGGGGACATVRARLAANGVELSGAGSAGALRVLVGPWARVRSDPAAAQIEGGPSVSGVFAEFAGSGGGLELVALDEEGRPARRLGPGTGLVAATRHGGAPPVWVVTGVDAAGAARAAALLDGGDLRDHYAVAAVGPEEVPLPLEDSG
jgi:hypothetical protein